MVYQRAIKGQPIAIKAVCEQREWEAMQVAQPGALTLIRSGFASKGEPEQLVRGTSGDPVPRNVNRPPAPPSVQ